MGCSPGMYGRKSYTKILPSATISSILLDCRVLNIANIALSTGSHVQIVRPSAGDTLSSSIIWCPLP